MKPSFEDLYEIWVKEPVDPSWSEWLNDFVITPTAGEGTKMTGYVKDQTDLYGLINKIRNLNLTLVCVQKVS